MNPTESEVVTNPNPGPNTSSQTQMPKKRGGLGATIIGIILIVVLGGGIAYAYVSGNLPFISKAPYDNTNFISGIAANVKKVQSAQYSLSIKINTGKRDANVLPLKLSTTPLKDSIGYSLLAAQKDFANVPNDASLNLLINGYGKHQDNHLNLQVGLSSDASIGGLSFSADVEFKKVADDYYVEINKFPSLFVDLSPIQQKWIKISKSDLGAYDINALFGSSTSTTNQEALQKSLDEAAQKDGLVTISGTPTKEMVNGETAYKYTMLINPEGYVQFNKDTALAYQANGYGQKEIASMQAQANDPNLLEVTKYIFENNPMYLWVNSQGIPVKLLFEMKLVPDNGTGVISDKQAVLTYELDITDINKTQPDIVAPAQSMSVQDVQKAFITSMQQQQQLKLQKAGY